MMKRRIGAFAVCLALCLCALLPLFTLPASAAVGTHGLYLECRANVTNWKTDGFMIDFYSDSSTALGTYWSNANWNMYTTPSVTKLGYNNITGGGAYAGLQYNNNGHYYDGIMSMWRWEYTDRDGNAQTLYADTMVGNSVHYSHEGSGTSCIMPYGWQFGQWYRELLFCWDDEETGETFIGTWFYDYEADEWTLFTYYNTHLVDSYINTDVNQFLENYTAYYNDRLRSWRYKNVYFMPHGSTDWISQPNVKMSTDYNMDAVGEISMGIADDRSYVWGISDGSNGKNVADPNYQHQEINFTLNQPAKPTLGEPLISSFDISDPSSITWTVPSNSTPQLAYELVVTDVAGAVLARRSGTRPEVRTASIPDVGTNAYKCTLTVRDVFGKEVTATATTPIYDAVLAQGGETPEPVDFNDVNRDGSVNVADISAALDIIAGAAEGDADVDGDGNAVVADITALLDRIAGVPVVKYSKGLVYTLNDAGTEYAVSGIGVCSDENINLPAYYAGKPVTSIGAYAFTGTQGLRSINIPDRVTTVGVYAFANCPDLTTVTLGQSLTAIKKGAFSNCVSLTGASIPTGVTKIDEYCYSNCTAFETLTLPGTVTRVEQNAFNGCEALENVTYTGSAWASVRICRGNDPLLSLDVTLTKPQSVKNGFAQEAGGIRYYIANEMQTGFKVFSARTYYFDPETGLMAEGTKVIDGTRYFFAALEYDDLTLWYLSDSEPDKTSAPQAWLIWLLENDAGADDPVYRQFAGGRPHDASLYPGTNDPSPFDYNFNFSFNKSEIDLTENAGTEDYAYTWELWYRKAQSGDDYACVQTSPYDVYDGDDPIYRLTVYQDGMTGLETDGGAPQQYEILILIYEGEELVGWKQTWANYTDSAEGYRQTAQVYYRNVTASSNMGAYGEISKAENILDGDQNTVCGQNFTAGRYVTLTFDEPQEVSEIFIQCKDEGTTTNADGTRGAYKIVAVWNGIEYPIADNVPAVTGTDGGYTVVPSEPVAAESVKVYITSWQGDCWACVADLFVKVTGDEPEEPVPPAELRLDNQGYILNMTATSSGFAGFGDINKPENVLDGSQSTVCGSGYDAGVEQSVTVTFPYKEKIKEIFVQCKDEGTTTNADGSRGTYDIYTVLNGKTVKVASNIPAVTGTNGGYTVSFDTPVQAQGVKVVITSWQGSNWACVADIKVRADAEIAGVPSNYDAHGYILDATADCAGFVGFGSVNDPANVLDGNQNTVCGSGFNASVEQRVTVTFVNVENIVEVFIQCKDEGTTTNADGSRGTYDLYAILDGAATLIASGVPAVTGTDGGYTVVLDTPVQAKAVKAVITSWQGSDWACVADIKVKADVALPEQPHFDENGYILDMTASSSGFAGFGAINDPSNVLDGNQNTVCGSGFNAGTEQSVTVAFPYTETVAEIFVQCKNEGTTTNADGSRGTYDLYAVLDGAATLIASGVPAVTGTDGGYTVVLDTPVQANAVKVVITSWQGSDWACVADIAVKVEL